MAAIISAKRMHFARRKTALPRRANTFDCVISEASLMEKVREIAQKPLDNDSFSSKSDSESQTRAVALASKRTLKSGKRDMDKGALKGLKMGSDFLDGKSSSSESSEEMSDSERVIRTIIRERKASSLWSPPQPKSSVLPPQDTEKAKAYIGLKARFSTIQREIIDKREVKERKRLQLKKDLRKLLGQESINPPPHKGHVRWKTVEYEMTEECDSSFLSTEAYDRIQTIPQFFEANAQIGAIPRRNRSVSTYVKVGKTVEDSDLPTEPQTPSRHFRLQSAVRLLLSTSPTLYTPVSRLVDSAPELLLVLQSAGSTLSFLGLYERSTAGFTRRYSPYSLPQVLQPSQVVSHYEFDPEHAEFVPLLLGSNHGSADAISIEFRLRCEY